MGAPVGAPDADAAVVEGKGAEEAKAPAGADAEAAEVDEEGSGADGSTGDARRSRFGVGGAESERVTMCEKVQKAGRPPWQKYGKRGRPASQNSRLPVWWRVESRAARREARAPA